MFFFLNTIRINTRNSKFYCINFEDVYYTSSKIPDRVSQFLLACQVICGRGFILMPSWSGVRRSTIQLASRLRLPGSRPASLQSHDTIPFTEDFLLIKVSVQKRERKGENNIKLFICTLQDTAMFTCSKYFTFSETVRRLNTECSLHTLLARYFYTENLLTAGAIWKF